MKNILIKGLEDGDLNKYTIQQLSQSEAGKNNKGVKHSEQTKKIWSDKKIGIKRDEDSVRRSIIGTISTRWEQTLNRVSKEDILAAQKKCGNHQSNTMNELGISFTPYKKLCKHYGIELKKSNYEKTEYARTKQSQAILVWKCSKREPYKPIGKPKEYYSVTFCCNSFEPKLHKGNMLRNMKNKTPYRDMFFEYK